MSDLKKLDELLVKVVDDINKCRLELKSYLSPETKAIEVATEPAVELVPITFEEVRTRLAELSRDGKTAQVRELIVKFGATKLIMMSESLRLEMYTSLVLTSSSRASAA